MMRTKSCSATAAANPLDKLFPAIVRRPPNQRRVTDSNMWTWFTRKCLARMDSASLTLGCKSIPGLTECTIGTGAAKTARVSTLNHGK